MYKIFLSVCNRLAVTKHCIEAIQRHSKLPYQLYVYNNHTNYLIDEHFEYFRDLYKQNKIAQITFNTRKSTFNAFSKASACNQFGLNHEIDPNKDKYDFLLIMDNDIIVNPDFDIILKKAWEDVTIQKLTDVKVISQIPGGIVKRKDLPRPIANIKAQLGKLGGSGFWCVRNNFFKDVGFLDLNSLVGQNKRHDISYWAKMERLTNGRPYIIGLDKKLCIHVGGMAGSVCNTLTANKKNPLIDKLIRFEKNEKEIGSLSFDEFYNHILNDRNCRRDW